MLRKTLLIVGAIALSFAVTACGNKSSSQKKADDGNAKLQKLNDINQALAQKGIVVYPKAGMEDQADQVTTQSINTLSASDLSTVIDELDQFVQLGKEILQIIDSGDVAYYGNRQQLADAVQRAENRAAEARSQRALKNTTGNSGSTTGTPTTDSTTQKAS